VLISAAKFNQLVYQYPIRIPERFSLVIRSLLTQEGICLTLQPDFKFLEVAYPYVAKRLLTDPDPALRERLLQVLFKDGLFQWKRLENLILLAREQVTMMNRNTPLKNSTKGSRNEEERRKSVADGRLDLTDTIKDGARVVATDATLRQQLLMAFTEDSRLHVRELLDIYRLVEGEFNPTSVFADMVRGIPNATRDMLLSWSDSVLMDRR
jgi:predicted unusual protein kinase regulating ubiquinone biosynthesis (AarF/ABC1/UbiB family)